MKRNDPLSIALLLGVVILLASINQAIQYSYAQDIKTFTIKSQLDEKVVQLGESNEIRITVLDRASDEPLSGTLVKVVSAYPGGTYYRTVSEFTDDSGKVSISIPTQEDSESDTVAVDVSVSQVGYPEATFTMYFAVVSEDVND